MLLMLALAPATQAQRPVLVTESAFAKRVGDRWEDGPGPMLSVTIGFMRSVSKRIGLGGVVQGGVAGDMYSSVGPRVRITDRIQKPGEDGKKESAMYLSLRSEVTTLVSVPRFPSSIRPFARP